MTFEEPIYDSTSPGLWTCIWWVASYVVVLHYELKKKKKKS